MRYIAKLLIVVLSIGLLSCEKKAKETDPVAQFTADPVAGPFTTVFVFDATSTYNEGESPEDLRIRWDWEGDGIFDTHFSEQRIRSHRFDEMGNYNVIMEVMNSIGWTDQEVFPITVYADSVRPVAAFDVDSDSSTLMNIFQFNAAESWDEYTTLEQLMFRWDWDGDSIWDTPFHADTCVHYKFTCPGEYRVRMQVKNYIHLTDTTSRKIVVVEI